ncbi:MAG: radical SAM protein, partial [Verrucomicrobiota bacterium]
MSFVSTFNRLPENLSPLLRRFDQWLSTPQVGLEALAQNSREVTGRNFGRTMRLFAPLYLSNECINNCSYCGFSRDNAILRVTLDTDQVVKEARFLHDQGFRNILLVAGEHPKFVNNGYLEDCLRRL